MPDYVKEFEESRERWVHGYFNWTDNPLDGEFHTARDGFDAGATWMQKKKTKNLKLVEAQEKHKEVMEENRIEYDSNMGKLLRAAFLTGWMASGGVTK